VNKLQKIADALNHSPVWNHTMIFVLLYFWEMVIFATVLAYKYFVVGSVGEALKVWLIMTLPLILAWLLLAFRNYRIHQKIGIWNYYRKRTRNGRLFW
jgi:hypothetical protein